MHAYIVGSSSDTESDSDNSDLVQSSPRDSDYYQTYMERLRLKSLLELLQQNLRDYKTIRLLIPGASISVFADLLYEILKNNNQA